ncbi:hypothetical protein CVT26_014517 [Gymnopilus dilepis]|uniref:Uncharacterized protein n=1 Tax=Gymnopilus dilepis TaxID=231916 RepID=A0A409W3B1_9AGAR|nr:hypothetical protein CVT26_014517 [Gymnopilus dilepis]
MHQLAATGAFLEIQFCLRGGDTSTAIGTLASLQKHVEVINFSSNEHQYHQHNLLEDLTSTMEDLMVEDIAQQENEDVFAETDLQSVYFPPEPGRDQVNSPPRKKQRTARATHDSDDERIALDLNQYLQANPTAWLEKCLDWSQDLNRAFQDRQQSNLSDQVSSNHYKNVISTLREMRLVKAGIFKHALWNDAVKGSGLAEIIYLWSDPQGLVLWKSSFVEKLFRKHKISTTLLLILERWTPVNVKSSWISQPFVPRFSLSSNYKVQKLGKYLYRAFKKKPQMIPREAYPSSVFFLLNFQNFFEAGHMWLGYALEKEGFQASFLNSKFEAEVAYKALMQHLSGFKNNEFDRIQDEALQIILRRSVDFRKLKRQVSEKFFANRPSLNSPCRKCKDRPAKERCIQKVLFAVKKLDKSVIGCGVSYSPRDKISAVPIRNSESGHFEERPVIHPKHDLHLKDIRCSPDILKRCGSMTYYFFDENDPDTVLDFFSYGAFPEKVLEKLISHHQRLQTVKSLKRGKQFNTYSQGQMFPKGSRAPAGGIPGDAYTMYKGLEAVDETSIEALFDDAEDFKDSMVLLEAARVIHPPLFFQLQYQVPEGDKLGITGATAYLCKNYASPLHFDKDACRGLCAQYELRAKSEGDEYGFIYGDYGFYVVSRSNSLWSFDSSMAHGTVLPSSDPLKVSDLSTAARDYPEDGAGDPPPMRISSGIHVTKPKKNVAAARKYSKVQASRTDIGRYWNVVNV